MLYFDFSREVLIKKKSFELKILKFFIIYSVLLQKPVFWALTLLSSLIFYPFTKFLSAILIYFPNCVIFKICFKLN